MAHVPVVIVGGGHAGLVMSRRLTERSIDHLVIERGEVAASWRNERWDSLRLLTPTWHAALPGGADGGHDPDGFLTAGETAGLIERYAATIAAPVLDHTTVLRLTVHCDGYEVVTDRGTWTCSTAVVATGGASFAAVPAFAAGLPPAVVSVTPLTYKRPQSLPDGGVLVVGGSASGVQLADEIHASGRPVTLAVGEHVRLSRTYRGRDIFWWTEVAGILGERFDQVDDLVRARHVPSPQLTGTDDRRSIDLNDLAGRGVKLAGRLGRIHGAVAHLSGGLANVCALADLKLGRLLGRLDAAATELGIDAEVGPPERFEPTRLPGPPVTELDIAAEGIRTVVWATGLRPDHSWIDLPVFDKRGRIRHDGGIVAGAPGLYVLGLSLLRRRRSSYLGGAAADTADLAGHLHRHLDTLAPPRRALLTS